MPIHGYPGGVISATPPTVSVSSASGVWTTEKQLQYQAQGVWPPGGVYPISRSLRFNSADQTNLTRTPGSAGNRKTWTMSFWHKTSIGSNTPIVFGAGDVGVRPSVEFGIYHNFDESRVSFLSYNGGGYDFNLRSTLSVRDPSAWYHFVVVFDTTQATNTNRIKVYINNVQITAWNTSTWPSQNFDGAINNTVRQVWSTHSFNASGDNLNGYLTEINLIDGQALTPSSFGQTNSNTGVWEPKAYSGTYGTNGYYLNFSDNSGTTSTTLGKDYSGNGNNWTPNNFSVTAGTGNDSLVDTPTSYGSDTGAGGTVRGNYATLNPLAKGSDAVLSNGNLDVVGSGTAGVYANVRSTIQLPTSGKWYCEFRINAQASGNPNIGILSEAVSLTTYTSSEGVLFIRPKGSDADRPYWVVDTTDASIRVNTTAVAVGDIFQVIYDADNLKVWMGINNTYYGISGGSTVTVSASDIASGTNPAYTLSSTKRYHFGGVVDQSTDGFSANFGQRAFAYTAPSGFKALCTQNLPTPTVVQGDDYFNTVLYTGNGSTQSVTGVGFQPDLVWYKGRSAAYNNRLYDVIRGVTNSLSSNLTDAESAISGVTAFNSDGFSLGSEVGGNNNGTTYVAWNWKANGAGSSNTAGTITSTVSANTTSGFSVVTYTGTGANATVGHGLGAAPSMIIIKIRSSSSYGWLVGHVGLTNQTTYYIDLNSAGAEASNSTVWNSTAPTSSVISLGTNVVVNTSSATYVAYCFAAIPGFSAFGRYTGNGSSDGPFVYCGFRPAFLLTKRASTAGAWHIYDSARSTYNINDIYLIPDTSAAENSGNNGIDFLSNGFKLRSTNTGTNENGTTIIYAAFASNPFKYALAR